MVRADCFSGLFGGFDRFGSAAFSDSFRGGTSSPPAAAKCVRTNSNILHQKGNCKQDMEKVLAELQKDEKQAKEEAKTTVQNLKVELVEIEAELEKLLDAYLGEVISAEDYKARKEKLITQKVELGEKIRDFEQKGLSWLEPAREFVLSLNQAAKLIETENKEEMTTFLKTIGSNHALENRQFVFAPKIQYKLAAERSEADPSCLQFPFWWNYTTLLEHFLNGTDRLRFAPAERSGAAEFPPHPPSASPSREAKTFSPPITSLRFQSVQFLSNLGLRIK